MGNLLDKLNGLRRFRVGSAFMVCLLGAALWLAATSFDAVPTPSQARKPSDSLSGRKVPTPVPVRRLRPSQDEAESHPAADEIPDETINVWLGRASRDPAGTLEEIMAIEDPHERLELLDWILSAWTTDGRSPALEWLVGTASRFPQDRFGEVLDLLVGSWAAEDALAAMHWVNEKLDEPQKNLGLLAIASAWGYANPNDMEAWILTQDSPQDFWVQELIQGLILSDPRRAMEWSTRVSDADLAREIQQNIIQSWLLADPASAEDFLQHHPTYEVEVKPETAIAE